MRRNDPLISLAPWSELRVGSHIILAGQNSWPRSNLKDLSDEELKRFQSFVNASAARSFLHRRSVLRQVLSAATGVPRHQINYATDTFGKLRLSNVLERALFFNLSQGNGICAVAICRHGEVGIDIEHVDSASAMKDVCTMLHTDEVAHIQQAKKPADAFLDLWVLKEAIAKRTGLGFSNPAHAWSALDQATYGLAQTFEVVSHRMCVSATNPANFTVWNLDAAYRDTD